MKRVLYGVLAVFMLTTLSVLALGIHAVTAQTMGMKGGISYYVSPPNCFTACTTATFRKEDIVKDTDKDEDDKPQLPFYAQFQSSPLLGIKETHDHETRSTIEREPPPEDIRAYISLGVFRV